MKKPTVRGDELPDAGSSSWFLRTLAFLMLLLSIPVSVQAQVESRVFNRSEPLFFESASSAPIAKSRFRGTLRAEQESQSALSSGGNISADRLRALPGPAYPGVLSARDRVQIYTDSLTAPFTFIGPALGAAVGQWRNEPPEWEQGAAGYGRRYGSGLGRNIITTTITFAVAAADGEDPRVYRSNAMAKWARARHAMTRTFVSQKPDGTPVPAYARITGYYGAAFVSHLWYPARDDAADVMVRGTGAVALNVAGQLFNEFWPDIARALHLKRW